MVENEQKRKEKKNLINSLASRGYFINFIDQDGKTLLQDDHIKIESSLEDSDTSDFLVPSYRYGLSLKQFLEIVFDFDENNNKIELRYIDDNAIPSLYFIEKVKDIDTDKKYSFNEYMARYFDKKEDSPLFIKFGDKKISVNQESIFGSFDDAKVEINTALEELYSSFGDKARLVKFSSEFDLTPLFEDKLLDIAQGKIVANYKEGHAQIDNSQSEGASEDESGIIPQTEGTNPQDNSATPQDSIDSRNAVPNDQSQMIGGKVNADAIFDGLAQVPGIKNINYKTATGKNLNTPVYYSNDGKNMEVTSVNGFVSVSDYLQLLKLIPGSHLDATLSDDNHYSVDLNPAFIPSRDRDIVRATPVPLRNSNNKPRVSANNENISTKKSKGLSKEFKNVLKVAGATVLTSALAIGFANVAKAPIIKQPVNPNPGVIDIEPTPVNPVNPVNPAPVKPVNPVNPVKPSKPNNNNSNNSNGSSITTKPGNIINEDITFPQEEPSKPDIVIPSRPNGNVIDSEITFPQEEPSNPNITEDDITRIDERPVSPTTPSEDFEFDVDHKTPNIVSPSFDEIIKDLNNKSNGGSKEEESTTAPSLDQDNETPDIPTPDRPSSGTIGSTDKQEESSSSDSFDDLRKYLEEKTSANESTTERETEPTTEEPTTEPVTEPVVEEPTTGGYEKPEIPTNKAPEKEPSEPSKSEPTTSDRNVGNTGNVIDDDINFDQEDLGNGIDFF